MTMGLGVMICATAVDLGSSPSPMTCVLKMSHWICSGLGKSSHSEGQVLGRKDAAEVFLVVYHKNAVCALGSTQLTCIGNGDGLGDGEGGERSQGRHSACLVSLSALATGRSAAFASGSSFDQVILNLASQGLDRSRGAKAVQSGMKCPINNIGQPGKAQHTHTPRHASTVCFGCCSGLSPHGVERVILVLTWRKDWRTTVVVQAKKVAPSCRGIVMLLGSQSKYRSLSQGYNTLLKHLHVNSAS